MLSLQKGEKLCMLQSLGSYDATQVMRVALRLAELRNH